MHFSALKQHFKEIGSPVMIGGDKDGASKTLIGVSHEEDGPPEFLIADPHYLVRCVEDVATTSSRAVAVVLEEGHVTWHSQELFQDDSFYNLCLPQLP